MDPPPTLARKPSRKTIKGRQESTDRGEEAFYEAPNQARSPSKSRGRRHAMDNFGPPQPSIFHRDVQEDQPRSSSEVDDNEETPALPGAFTPELAYPDISKHRSSAQAAPVSTKDPPQAGESSVKGKGIASKTSPQGDDSSSSKARRRKRYTIEADWEAQVNNEDYQPELILYQQETEEGAPEEPRKEISRLGQDENLIDKMQEHPHEWRSGIIFHGKAHRQMMETVVTMRKLAGDVSLENKTLKEEITELKAQGGDLAQRLRDALSDKIVAQNNEKKALTNLNQLKDVNIELTYSADSAKSQLEGQTALVENTQRRFTEYRKQYPEKKAQDDEDANPNTPFGPEKIAKDRLNQAFLSRNNSSELELREVEDDNKFPDAPKFYGRRDKYPSFRSALLRKFASAPKRFRSDQSKISYTFNRCEEDAYNVISHRDLDKPNPYEIWAELLQDLDNMYLEKDMHNKNYAKITNESFRMKPSESLNDYITRFLSTVAPTRMTEEERLFWFPKHLLPRLYTRWVNLPKSEQSSLSALIDALREIDWKLEEGDARKRTSTPTTTEAKPRNKTRAGRQPVPRTTANPSKGTSEFKKATGSWTQEFVDRVKKLDRCLRCLKPGHRYGDANAACKNSPPLTQEQAEMKLSVLEELGPVGLAAMDADNREADAPEENGDGNDDNISDITEEDDQENL